MSFLDHEFTRLNLILLVIIVILSGSLLAFTWAAQKDMESLKIAYTECRYQISLVNRGMLPLFTNNSLIVGDLNETKTSN